MKRLLLLCKIFVIGFTLQMQGQAINEGFNDITTLVPGGWAMTNNSSPLGGTGWFQGTPTTATPTPGPFNAQAGANNSYIGANFNNTGNNGTISNWLISPNRTLKNGDVVTFYTRKPSPDTWFDRLELRMSTAGAGTNVGANATSVGTFTTVLLSVNPTLVGGVYPTTWTQFSATISGLTAPTSGRLAFRYFVTGAGALGTNSDYIGIDTFVYTPYVCPTITMTPAGSAITAANGGMAYSFSFGNSGTLGTPTYTISGGALPAGLTLSTAGVVSGTPTVTGNFAFNVTVNDNSGCSASQGFTLLVNNCTFNFLSTLPTISSQCSVTSAMAPPPAYTDTCGNSITPTTATTFPITAQGTSTIVWSYQPLIGAPMTRNQSVSIIDATSPVPTIANLPNITAQCQVTSVTTPSATDNCVGVVQVFNDTTLPITAQGTTTMTWTYLDENGNTSSQTQDVVITDTTAPTPNAASLPNVTAQCQVTQAMVTAPSATDNCGGAVTVTNNATFPITSQGTTVITWSYNDIYNNTSTQTQNVVITDTTAPVANAASLPTVTGQCSVTAAAVGTPSATDNCSGVVAVTNNATFPITASGTTVITWTYTDASNNSSTQQQNVVITDTTAPVADAASLPTVTGQCSVSAAAVGTPSATDNCSGTVTVTNNATFPITASGTTVITWTYTDAANNMSTQTQNVVISDTTAPVADAASLATITAQCQVNQSDVTAPTATDNCSGTVTVTNNASFPITATGTVITWTYTDAANNSSTQTQNVVINDTTAPVPNAASLPTVNGQCSVSAAAVGTPSATDNCGGTVTVSSDATFPITAQGTTVITWMYMDAANNMTSQTQNVIIADTTAPTPDAATLPAINAQCQVNQADVTAPTATDNCSGTVTVTNNASFPITSTGTVITWTYTDAANNSTTQTQNVVIADTTAPVADASSLPTVTGQCSVSAAAVGTPSATDNCAGSVTVSNNATFPITASGTTVITWTYTDASNNSSTQTQNVVIADTTAPVADASTLPAITAQCQVAQSDVTAPTATDNCSSVTVTNDATFPITAQGTSTITWTYTDAANNSSTQTQSVTIMDNMNPTALAQDITVSIDGSGNATVTGAQMDNGSSDNCSIATITVTPNSFSCLELGAHVVTVTVTDMAGNSASTSATVTVDDANNLCPLAVAQVEKSNFVIYPNPTSNVLYIQPGGNEIIRSATVYSVTGQVIMKTSFSDVAERYSLSLAPYADGIYMVKLETSTGYYTQRVIKQN